jgi:large subunit ribosomal protein L28e
VQPAKNLQTTSFSSSTPSRKIFKSVVNSTAKKGYRSDLRAEAVARASAVKLSQGNKKERKSGRAVRGVKAKKAAEKSAEKSS